MNDDIPDWVMQHAQKCRVAFNLEQWPINLCMVDSVDGGKEFKGEYIYAMAHTDPRSLDARIEIRRDLETLPFSYVTITHEFLHCATVYQDRSVRRIIELLPKKQRAYAWQLWRDGNEQTIELLARSLTPLLKEVSLNDGPQEGSARESDQG